MGVIVDLDGVTVYRAAPTVAPRGAVIVIHEIWGLVPHIRDVADRFAAEGYLAIAPDILSDAGITPEVGAELEALMRNSDEATRTAAQPMLREKLSASRSPEFAAEAVAKLMTVVDALAAEPGVDGRIGVTGYCFGGHYSFELAVADDRVKAAVPFYGSPPALDDVGRITCPVLALYGEIDPPLMESLPALRQAMTDAQIDFADHVYPGAKHAFFNDTSASVYDPDAAADAWARTLAFFDAHVAEGGVEVTQR